MPAKKTAPTKQAPVRRRAIVSQHHETLSVAEMNAKITRDRKAAFLLELENQLGVITYAAKKCGINRRLIYDWRNEDPEFDRAVREVDDVQVDFVERKLIENIQDKDTRAITFYLATKGRNRGYTTRVEVTGVRDQPLQVENTVKGEVIVNVEEARGEMNDKGLIRAMRALAKVNPAAFSEATSIAIANGALDKS